MITTISSSFGMPRFFCFVLATAALCLPAPAAPPIEKLLHNFGTRSTGASPSAGLIRDSAGNLYGTAFTGGLFNYGVVFKLDASGHQTVLHNFTGGADGGNPNATLIRDSAGNLYGTTAYGGASAAGVVFKLDSGGNLTVLHSFTGGADGSAPQGVTLDAAGNLYGIAAGGGAFKLGVVYRLDPAGNETVLHSFSGNPDGEDAEGPLVRDSAGNLYGATAKGGANNCGILFKLDATGVETVLHTFTGAKDGRAPISSPVLDSAGNLYGTTSQGGGKTNAGVVYKMSAAGQFTTLYSFPVAAQGYPSAGVVLDAAGNLYGATGGTYPAMAGIVYKLSPSGQETTLYAFTGGVDGADAISALILDPSGNVYGTTNKGGPGSVGTVYEVSSTGQETVLYAFRGALDGALPAAGVIGDAAGNLYGTTQNGGTSNQGIVFKTDASGHQTVLYNFSGGTDAAYPTAPVTRDAAGNLYGTTVNGGAGYGTVYKIDTTGQETVLYSFMDGLDGGYPYAGVVLDPAGNVYGTAVLGGTFGAGVVFKVDPTGHETVLYSFTGFGDGYQPYGGVIRDSAGNLYGTADGNGGIGSPQGVVYKLDITGHQTVLYSFTGGADGGGPRSALIRDAAGNLYGTAYYGGIPSRICGSGCGVVYKVDPAGNETVLYAFLGGSDGGIPTTGVIRDAAGNLYGTTATFGSANHGVLYRVDPSGDETVLHTFTGGADGGSPNAILFRDSTGAVYGTTLAGGTAGSGVLFKVTP